MNIFKNIKAIKTTIAGIIFISAAFVYLFHLQKENNTIIFGFIIIGIFLIFSPDTIFKSGAKIFLKMLGITTKGSTNIEIDDVEINNNLKDNDIPNER